MPHLITREQALARLGTNGSCFICDVAREGSPYIVEQKDGVIVFLSRYPRFWGQLMIAPVQHVENFTALDEATWERMNRSAHKAARILEKLFNPARCYVASTGSPQNLPMTCPHIHVNVVPVPGAELKPSEVFTWKNGLYDGTEEEWKTLFANLSNEWKK